MLFRLAIFISVAAIILIGPVAKGHFSSPMLLGGGGSVGSPTPPPPGTTPCDQGPATAFPTGQLGTDLTAAGFTKCALNADFTTSTTDANGVNWSNTATYLNKCMATPSSLPFRFYLMFGAGNGDMNIDNSEAACNRAAITTVSGSPAFTYSFLTTDSAAGHGMVLWWPGCGNGCTGPTFLPNQGYFEITYIITSGQSNPTNVLFHAIEYTVPDNGTASGNGYIDSPFLEAYPTAAGANNSAHSVDWYPASAPKVSLGTFVTINESNAYHTIAEILSVASDGSSIADCFYYDGVGVTPSSGHTNCSRITITGSTALFQARQLRLGNFIGGFGSPFAITQNVTMAIKQIRIFTCPAYKTTYCWSATQPFHSF